MSERQVLGRVATSLALVVYLVPTAYGQTARSASGANAQLLQQMQQLASERTALQADTARIKKELDDVRKERDELKAKQQVVDQRAKASTGELARSTAQRESLERELNETRAKTQELIGRFRETLQQLKQMEAEGSATRQTLAAREQQLKVCVDRNAALYKLNGEILTHMEHESTWSRLARAEPFTKIKRVELENLADDYRARADDQRINSPATGAPPARPGAPSPPTVPQARPMSPDAAAAPAPPATPTAAPGPTPAH